MQCRILVEYKHRPIEQWQYRGWIDLTLIAAFLLNCCCFQFYKNLKVTVLKDNTVEALDSIYHTLKHVDLHSPLLFLLGFINGVFHLMERKNKMTIYLCVASLGEGGGGGGNNSPCTIWVDMHAPFQWVRHMGRDHRVGFIFLDLGQRADPSNSLVTV